VVSIAPTCVLIGPSAYTWRVIANTSQPGENLGMRKLCTLALLGRTTLFVRGDSGTMGRFSRLNFTRLTTHTVCAGPEGASGKRLSG
jgi:hypothetical protein